MTDLGQLTRGNSIAGGARALGVNLTIAMGIALVRSRRPPSLCPLARASVRSSRSCALAIAPAKMMGIMGNNGERRYARVMMCWGDASVMCQPHLLCVPL
jgi:hypothetical protein